MNYVLLYVNEDNEPQYIQGTVEHINARFREVWESGAINPDDFDYRGNYQLLGLEDGILTPMVNVACSMSPQFTVN